MRKITLSRGAWATVDDDDYMYLNQFSWHLTANGYAGCNMKINGKWTIVRMHRFLLEVWDDTFIDHKNGIKTDNRRDNIRKCSNMENMWNRGKNRRNTSGYKCVQYHPGTGKWRARIGGYHIGLFDSPEKAHAAYCDKAVELHGEFANFG